MAISKAKARWSRGFKDGNGLMQPAHAGEIPFSAGSRFEGQAGSNPEEVLGAALAGCFSMALTLALEKAGHAPQSVETTADTKLEPQGDAFAITEITLSTEAKVPGIDKTQFDAIAEATKKGCPVSKALSGTTITLNAAVKA